MTSLSSSVIQISIPQTYQNNSTNNSEKNSNNKLNQRNSFSPFKKINNPTPIRVSKNNTFKSKPSHSLPPIPEVNEVANNITKTKPTKEENIYLQNLRNSSNFTTTIGNYETLLKEKDQCKDGNKPSPRDKADADNFLIKSIENGFLKETTIEDINAYCKEKGKSTEEITNSIEHKKINIGPFGVLILNLYNKQRQKQLHEKISIFNIPNGIEANSLYEFPNAVYKAIKLLEEANKEIEEYNKKIELQGGFNPAIKATELLEEFNAHNKKSKILMDLCNLYETLNIQVEVMRWDNPNQPGKMYTELQEPWKQFDLSELELLLTQIGYLNEEMHKKLGAEASEAAQKLIKGLEVNIKQKKEITEEQNRLLQKLMKHKDVESTMEAYENILEKFDNTEYKSDLNIALLEYVKNFENLEHVKIFEKSIKKMEGKLGTEFFEAAQKLVATIKPKTEPLE